MEQAESNLNSRRVFTREKWSVQLGMGARGIACCSKCDLSGRIVMQVPALKLRLLPSDAICVSQCEKPEPSIGSVQNDQSAKKEAINAFAALGQVTICRNILQK